MNHKEMCFAWVEERKMQDEDDKWWVCDPQTGEIEEGPFASEEEIDEVLWKRAVELDAPTLYGIDA